jgi:hypothetical protein
MPLGNLEPLPMVNDRPQAIRPLPADRASPTRHPFNVLTELFLRVFFD